ncbi:MAG: DUF4351 domain-containing protein [Pigmentiphaga sp.]|nr:DUF4351 domain-containing protein [Pigmentiphaga sp.]
MVPPSLSRGEGGEPPRCQLPQTVQQRYLLVDEGALVDQQTLPEDNLAALLFRLEHNRSIEDVQNLIQRVYNYTEADPALRRAFFSWTRFVLLPRALPEVAFPPTKDLLEIKDMLADQSRSWTHQWKMEGFADGRVEGRVEGEVNFLRKQLQRKFGPLPAAIQQRLEQASAEELDTWLINILEADSLEAVFQ